MSISGVTESVVEEETLKFFAALGYEFAHGPDIAPGELAEERASYSDVVLRGRLEEALRRLNPTAPPIAIDEAVRRLLAPDAPGLVQNNRRLHALLRDGVEVEVARDGGQVRGERLRLVEFQNADENDWLVVNQLTVVEGQAKRRPDVVVFLNGLPVAVIELKNATDENATIRGAFNQLQTYKAQIPSLFYFNELLVISDGISARIGTVTSPWERFAPWRTVEGDDVAPLGMLELAVLIPGVFQKERFLDLVHSFIVFEEEREHVIKKLAGYHQFHAVRTAIGHTVRAMRPGGDRKVGVVWHTQGSGKSLTMTFYAGRVVQEPAMENPTVVILTDRNDLDDQLFGTFARCHELLRQKPVQAESRDHLHELLQVASGGVIFTTIQKFLPLEKGDRFPQLSDRRNIVVIADEAHRSQYGFRSKLVRDAEGGHLVPGFAQHLRDALPNASYVGFTGTPIELTDKNTRAVFGDYISVYDIQRAVEDKATVPIYYESRLAKLDLDGELKEVLDSEFEQLTEQEEDYRRERLKSKWAALEAIVGNDKRVDLIAADVVDHFQKRSGVMAGKAMVVCMSRRICVEMYEAIRGLRPDWHDDDDAKGALKVIMTGSAADREEWQGHIRNKPRLRSLADRFKDPDDELQIVIVRDMWLTGFDAPCLHTMYIDKPMRGHGLMQAIARVNRVFRDKPGGLVVDYLGLGECLKEALQTYTESGGQGQTAIDQNEAIAVMEEKLEVCRALFHGFDYSKFLQGTPSDRLHILPAAQQHVFEQDDGRDRLVKVVLELTRAHALAVPREEALEAGDEVAFFQTVKAAVVKSSVSASGKAEVDVEHAIRQMVSRAITTDGVIDVFAAAGIKKPDISILSDEFLQEVRALPHRNLAVELLRKLLNDEVKVRRRTNLIQSEAFSDKLEQSMRRYKNRAIQTVEVIEELIGIAKEMRKAKERGEALKLSDAELAFYDALETNDSAVAVMGDGVLTDIARDLTETIRNSVTIDWTMKETVRANLRRLVRRKLKKYGYPPDKAEKAVQTILAQAELLAADWAA